MLINVRSAALAHKKQIEFRRPLRHSWASFLALKIESLVPEGTKQVTNSIMSVAAALTEKMRHFCSFYCSRIYEREIVRDKEGVVLWC